MANGWLTVLMDVLTVLTNVLTMLTGVLTNVLTKLARRANNLRVTGSIPTLDTRRERPVSGL